MKHKKTTLISLIFISIIIMSILLKPTPWRNTIETYVNNKLKENSEWQVVLPELNGNLLGKITGSGMRLFNKDGTEIVFGDFNLKLNYIKSIFSNPTLSFLHVIDMEVHPVFKVDKLSSKENDSTTPVDVSMDFNFLIEDIKLEGFVEIPVQNDTFLIDIDLNSRLIINPTNKEFYIEEFSASLNDTSGYILLRNTSLKVFETNAELAPANGVINGLSFNGEIYYDWTVVPDLTGDIRIDRYEFPKQPYKYLPLKPKFSSLETFLHFESDLKQFQGDLIVKNPLGLLMKGELSLTRHEGYYSLNRLGLESEESTLSFTGIYEDNGRLSGNALLTQFDLSKWIMDQKKTNVNGTIIIEGNVKKQRIGDISMTLEINESQLYKDRDISVSGSFLYNDDVFSFDNPLNISVGPSFVNVSGFADLKNENIDLDLKLNEASVFLINNFWSDSLKSGTATGDLRVSGFLKNPMIKAELDCRNLAYKETYLENITLNAHWTPSDTVGDGFFRGKIGKGSWSEYGFDYGLVDIAFSPKGIEFQSAEFKQEENFMQISGILSPDTVLSIDRIQVAYENHYFINAKPFSAKFEPNKVEIYPFELHVDDGIATGQMVIDDNIRGQLHLTNINADIMKLFTNDVRYHISGMSFGDISIMDVNDDPELKMDIILKNGVAARQKFSELVMSGSIYKSTLNIDEISMVSDDKEIVTISGYIPIGKIEEGERKFDFYMIFDDLDLSLVTQFTNYKIFTDGKITGGYHLGGNPKNTIFDFDMVIDDAKWDRLQFGKVNVEGLFDGKRLYFNKFSSEYHGSDLLGSAYLPLDYNLSSENFGRYFENDSLWLIVNGKTNNLAFLSAYISTIDSINGEFDLELELSGPKDRLIRNGHITSDNAVIYSIQLEDPIRNVAGHADLINNQLLWSSLSGTMVEDPAQNKKTNISVFGSMDLNRFFNPYYHLNIIGEELHFRTLLGDIEGICNLDLSLTGRDTIEISGEIEPVDAVMYQEFTEGSDVTSSDGESSIQINYLLNFPITGDFALRNSQIDAHLSGELSMTQLGERDIDFGGELNVRGGKFYFYQNVFTISEGYMAFNGKGFNPYMDLEAFTKIEEEHIIIKLVGSWDNPQPILESSSGFSEGDIFELLTFGKRFEDQEISAKGFGLNLAGSYLERQFEKNFLQATGLKEAGIVDDVNISGTAGLMDSNNLQDFEISAERQITDNLSLNYSYHRSFSLSNPVTNKVGVEFKVNRFVSLVGNVDELGNMHVKYRLRYTF